MNVGIRELINDLEANGQLHCIERPVDLRHVSALTAQSDRAVYFARPRGYDMPVVSGLTNSRERLAIAAGVPFEQIEAKLRTALDRPIPPEIVERGACQEVVLEGGAADVTSLPVPVFSELDGGPFITAGVVLANDREHGLNAGVYRLMVYDRETVGIDIVTPNNLNTYCQRAFARGEAVPIGVSIGTHPYDVMSATYKAALGINEVAISGGLRGEPVELARCRTVDALAIANAEIVLEGEIQPDGWVHQEGRFGEFTRLMGGIHMNPLVKVRAITHRRDPIYYALHMPWENIWISSPIYEAAARRVLKEAGVEVTAVNVTPGGCCHWHVVAAIKAKYGDGKNALAALLSIADIKHAIVTDSDIDIFDPVELEWAIATRVQADRDVLILSHARAKPLDPSILPGVKTTAKMGIDATISEGIPRERYQRIVHPAMDRVRLEDYLGRDGSETGEDAAEGSVDGLAEEIEAALGSGWAYYAELLERFEDRPYRRVVEAMTKLWAAGRLDRDREGRYGLKGDAGAGVADGTAIRS